MGARRIDKAPKQASTESWLTRRLVGSVLLIGMVGGLLGFTMWQFAQTDTLPIQQVQVKGEFVHLDKRDLYHAVGDLASAGFFNVDVRAVKEAAESLPWVESASVRRVWPDTLQLHIHEQIPLARWQGGGIVNRHGDVVLVDATDRLMELPLFKGPQGTAKMLAERYQRMSAALAGIELAVTELVLNERRAWQVNLNNGVLVLLGRAALDAPLSRFVAVYKEVLKEKVEKIQSVDLRYTNGFAVRWTEEAS